MRNAIGFIITLVLASSAMAGEEAQKSDQSAPWVMHRIDNEMWNHNSLSEGDVNGDGSTDYAVMHEGPDKYTFILHPGKGGDPKAPWKKVVVGEGRNPEYSDFGDFDGDGRLDVVGIGGNGAGASIFWGSGSTHIAGSKAWSSSFLEQTRNRGHFLYVRTRDLNGDGAPDIVIGGRLQGTHDLRNMEGKRTAGIVWIESPADRKDRRDPSKWTVHDIDSETKGGHGFVFADMDGDGDDDIVNCNADWNTRDSEEHVVWYENPGRQSSALRRQWPQHLIYQGGEFFSKANVAVGDLDGDGLVDVCVPTTNEIFYFRSTSANSRRWEKIVIPKDERTRWLQRPLVMADLNADGKMELVGMLIHDLEGRLPSDKAAVYMMTYEGKRPAADNWSTRVIKWGDGVDTKKAFRGEKWDHCRLADIDGDGDIDIVGNCEEHYDDQKKTIIGVVWFENPMISKPAHTDDGKERQRNRT